MGTRGQNAARQVGKFSPSGNGLSQWFNLGAVATAGLPGLAIPVIGQGAKMTAEAMTRGKVKGLIELMAAGGTREQLVAAQRVAQDIKGPAGAAIRKMVAAKLSRVAAIAGGAPQLQPQNAFARLASP
jgi:hypothetical protein